jgi:hypothetical protein
MNRGTFSALLLALLFLAGSCSSTGNRPQKKDPQQEQLEVFGDSIELEWKHDKRVLTYCPNQTCVRFFIPARNSTKALIDFSYLYLYDIRDSENDPHLEAFKTSVTAKDLRDTVELHQEDCAVPPEDPIDSGTILCVLKKMVPRHDIRAEAIRMKEHSTYSSELNLLEMLDSSDVETPR